MRSPDAPCCTQSMSSKIACELELAMLSTVRRLLGLHAETDSPCVTQCFSFEVLCHEHCAEYLQVPDVCKCYSTVMIKMDRHKHAHMEAYRQHTINIDELIKISGPHIPLCMRGSCTGRASIGAIPMMTVTP